MPADRTEGFGEREMTNLSTTEATLIGSRIVESSAACDPDEYHEIKLDLGDLIDDARDRIINGIQLTVEDLVESYRVDHLRKNSSLLGWLRLRPLVQEAAARALNEAVAAGEIEQPITSDRWPEARQLELSEYLTAKESPDCIVENYLFADVALLPAPGGFGKTTLMLYEAACIAHGSPTLHGRHVLKPGPVVIITAEDGRETMAARLRQIIFDNGLFAKQTKILQNLYINDVAGLGLKLTEIERDVVVSAKLVGELLIWLKKIQPVLVIVDPAVSFGVGESRVNDAEQGLVEVARRLRNEIGCCVRFIHHTGKQNARDGAVDQYAGRGGSAFADGARMVHVLARLIGSDWLKATGSELKANETGMRLVSAKMSFCAAQPDIYLRRSGFRFEVVTPSNSRKESIADLIYSKILTDYCRGILRSKKSIEDDLTLGSITRAQRRTAITELLLSERIEPRKPPAGKGASQYLHPCQQPSVPDATVGDITDVGPPEITIVPTSEAPSLISPLYRACRGGEIASHHDIPNAINLAAKNGEMGASWRNQEELLQTESRLGGGSV